MVEKLNTQNWWLNQDNNLGNIQKQTSQVICRIFFVRHGQSKDEAEKHWLPQDPKTPLSPLGEEQIEKTGQKLQEIGLDTKNTVLLYAGWTERIRVSKKILEKYHIGTTKENKLLETTEKQYNSTTNEVENSKSHMQGVADQLKNITDLVYGEILESFEMKDDRYSDKKNIVLLGHKSSEWFPQLANERKEDTILHGLRIKPGEVFEMDIDSDNKLVNYDSHKEILHLTLKNHKEILAFIWEEIGIKSQIKRLANKEIQFFELQKAINKRFHKHPELYEKYFISSNPELMIFCLANFIELKNNQIIEANFAKAINILDNDNFNEKAKTIWNILSQSKEKLLSYTDLFLRTLYVDGKIDDHLSSYIKAQVKDKQEILTQIEYYESLMKHHEKHIQPNISEIRNKSLDERFHTKKDNKEIDNNFNLWDKDIEENCLHILDNNQTVVIEWDWWSGKSFFSVYFQEQLKKKYFMYNNTSYFPIFIQLSGKDWEKIIEDIEEQQKCHQDVNSKTVYIFESLDESKFCTEGGINILLDYIQQNDLKSVINTRAWYLDTKVSDVEKWNIKKYNIKWMKNHMRYVEDFFNGKQNFIENYKQFQDKIGEKYMEENSLFVTILCELIQEGGKNLEKIDSKWKLFNAIVEQRLSKREGKKDWRKPNINTKKENNEEQFKKEIQERLKILEEIAYYKINNWGKIEEKNIDNITDLDYESLSFLFKKNDQGEFGFIHKSFEDYFLLRHFVKRPEKLKEIIKKSYKKDNNMKLAILAIKEWYEEIIELLIDKWYNVNEKDDNWMNAFIWACGKWKLEIAKWLYNKWYNINEKDNNWNNAFMWACFNWELEVAKWLVNKIKINEKNNDWNNAFIWACNDWQLEIVKWLFNKIENINEKNNYWINAFMYACMYWQLEVAKWLYNRWCNINEKNNYWINAFMFTCGKWKLEVAKWLVDKIENINERDNDWDNAFMYACMYWQLEVAKWLIDKIGNIDEKANDWNNVFIWACSKWQLEIVKWLYLKIKNINEKNNRWQNAFMFACKNWQLEIVQWLCWRIENIDERDNKWNNAFRYACYNWQLEIAKWLFNKIKYEDLYDTFLLVCNIWQLEIAKWLFDKTNERYWLKKMCLYISKTKITIRSFFNKINKFVKIIKK